MNEISEEVISVVAAAIENQMASDDNYPEDIARAALKAALPMVVEISEEMVEAAAMALKPNAWRDDVPEQWRDRQPLLRDIARKDARAALEAALPMMVEECAKIADLWTGRAAPCSGQAQAIAKAIRARK